MNETMGMVLLIVRHLPLTDNWESDRLHQKNKYINIVESLETNETPSKNT